MILKPAPIALNHDDHQRGRLRMLRSDLQDLIYLDMCCYILSILLNGKRQTPQTYHVVKTRLWYILEKDEKDEKDETVNGENK
jgi:T-complex protein 11